MLAYFTLHYWGNKMGHTDLYVQLFKDASSVPHDNFIDPVFFLYGATQREKREREPVNPPSGLCS